MQELTEGSLRREAFMMLPKVFRENATSKEAANAGQTRLHIYYAPANTRKCSATLWR